MSEREPQASQQPTLDDTDLDKGAAAHVDASTVAPGTVLGRYEARQQLGQGGMGEVWLAHDTELDREVAIKVLRRDRSSGDGRMKREAQAMARLRHPNVVTVHDVGTWGERVFVAMEYVRGRTLDDWLKESTRTPSEVLRVFASAAKGLAAAHEAGLVHRDFKPDNVMVGEDGRVQVMDFGLARAPEAVSVTSSADGKLVWDEMADASGEDEPRLVSIRLTATGAVLGTPAYMAPEQHLGATTHARSDQFSFAVALYEALYGERPFEGTSVYEIAANVTSGRVRPVPRDSRVPERLRRVLLRALSRAPEDRYPSMAALSDALDQAVTNRWKGWALGLSACAVGGALWVAGTRTPPDPCADAAATIDTQWNDETRTLARNAFAASSLGFASDAFTRFDERLTGYTDRLRGAAEEACRDTRVRGVQSTERLDAQRKCLQARELSARTLGRLATSADADFVVDALQAATNLPSIVSCERADQDTATTQIDPQMDARLMEANMLLELGRLDEVTPMLDDIEASLREAPSAPARMYLMDLRATTALGLGHAEEALAAAEEEMWLAIEFGTVHDQIRACISVVHANIVSDDTKAGLRWTGQAHALLRKAGGGTVSAQSALGLGESSLLRDVGRVQEGLAVARSVLDLAASDDVAPQRRRLGALQELAAGTHALGELEASREHLEEATAIAKALYGDGHPTVADLLVSQATLAAEMGEHDRARRLERDAVKLLDAAYADAPDRMSSSLARLAITRMRRGEFASAATFLQERLRVLQESNAPPGAETAWTTSTLGVAYWFLGEYAESERMHRRALDLSEKLRGADNPDTAMIMDNLATALERQGRIDEALALHRKALPILEKSHGPQSVSVGVSLRDHARALRSGERWAEAVELLERSVRIFQAGDSDPREEAQSRFDLAQTLWHVQGEQPRAIAMARLAGDVYAEAGEVGLPELQEVEAWLAEHDDAGTPSAPSATTDAED
mgnify:CR=1 FL=1